MLFSRCSIAPPRCANASGGAASRKANRAAGTVDTLVAAGHRPRTPSAGTDGGAHALDDRGEDRPGGAEVEAHVPGSRATALRAVDQRHACLLEEERAGAVAEAQLPAVQPGQVGALRRPVADLRQVLGEQS